MEDRESAGKQLRRSAYRSLGFGPRLGADGDVLYERDGAELILWYISALETS